MWFLIASNVHRRPQDISKTAASLVISHICSDHNPYTSSRDSVQGLISSLFYNQVPKIACNRVHSWLWGRALPATDPPGDMKNGIYCQMMGWCEKWYSHRSYLYRGGRKSWLARYRSTRWRQVLREEFKLANSWPTHPVGLSWHLMRRAASLRQSITRVLKCS